jgi:RNA polymerase sigma-70 factor (ECF subfamily)
MRRHMKPDTTIEGLAAALADDLNGVFPAVVRRLQDDVFSGALRMTGSYADAEDITQEAFLRAYRALTGYPARRIRNLQLRGWIWTIAANLCRNRARTLSRRRETLQAEPTPVPEKDPGPEDAVMVEMALRNLAGHLSELAWAQRAAVVLRHVVGLSYREIAEALDRPLGTVKNDVHRGLDRLRTRMTKEAS